MPATVPIQQYLRLPRLLLAAGLCLSAAACRPAEPANVVLITVDTLRADRLNPYGYAEIQTPAIARLAEEGIVFEKAFADTSWTLPSLSSVMTGKYPSEHRVRSWHDTLKDREQTLAEKLKAAGYHTAAIVGSYPLDRHFGLDQGFDHYDDTMTQSLFVAEDGRPVAQERQPDRAPQGSRLDFSKWQMSRERGNAYRTDEEVATAAIHWLEDNPESPIFLWVHFFGPHEKGKHAHVAPEDRKADTERQIARYDPDVEAMDRQVGRFLDRLRADPRFKDTAIIFHSDHGQTLKEHMLFGHGFDIFDTTVHVPLIVRLPDARRSGSRVKHLVRNLDIFTTILGLAQLEIPTEIASRDLLHTLPEPDNHAYLETHHPMAFSVRPVQVGDRERKVGQILRGIRTDDTKLISHQPFLAPSEDRSVPLDESFVTAGTRINLYDPARDPVESKNLAPNRAHEVARLRALLNRYDDGSGASAEEADLSEAARERLRSLGYQP